MTAGQRGPSVHTAEDELLVERLIDAPKDVIWRALTEQAHAVSWWGPKGNTVTRLEMDVRPGGSWQKCMRLPDGQEVCNGGVYREVAEQERLAFTYSVHGVETLVTVTLSDEAGKTRVTLRHAPFASSADRDSHLRGWTSTLERFAEFVTAWLERERIARMSSAQLKQKRR